MIWFINYSTIITLCMIFIITDCIRTFAMVENQGNQVFFEYFLYYYFDI